MQEASRLIFFSLFDVLTFSPFDMYETKYNKDKCISNPNNSDIYNKAPVKSEIGPLRPRCWRPSLCVKSAV